MTKIKRNKIAIVHVLYPPLALGGATRIVVDEVDTITSKYGDEFEVVVFTADIQRQPPYRLNVYPYAGYRVYSLSITATAQSNWNHRDENVEIAFDNFLEFEKPDIIHFHCIQILTASITEAASKRDIPYFVTAHDAWWISDYQFLHDQSGKIYLDGHPDPFEEFALPNNVSLEQSLTRRAYLKQRLAAAEMVLPVSKTYGSIYRANGIQNLRTITNGISRKVNWQPKDTSYSERLICGHVGGISDHKGFHLFKEAVSKLSSDKIEVLIVDHSKNKNYQSNTRWGSTPVKIIGHVDQENIADLYKQIDVLFAPSVAPESFGLVTREAAACGCWVVASDIGAIGEDVTERNGFTVPPTVAALTEILTHLVTDVEKFKKVAQPDNLRYSDQQTDEVVKLFRGVLHESSIAETK